eukprot:scaffold2285_cov380-Prasinococcus_capsulatus_cf.AAC.4
MLKASRGAEIDMHDTIFRHNTPLGKFARHVGNRSDIVWVKTKYKSMPHQHPKKAWALLMDVHDIPGLRYHNMPVFLRAANAKQNSRNVRALYRKMGFSGRKHPSGGMARPFNMLASGLCRRIDLYGFSGDMGGKYFR